jgi:hypothetical protein
MSSTATRKDIIASLDASFDGASKLPNPKKMKKKKKLSGDARRRAAKKRKLMETGTDASKVTRTTTPETNTSTDTTMKRKKKKKSRKNVKCECSRCGRNLQKKNLKKHLEHCDGTRYKYDPNHIPSHVREKAKEANTLTDETLMGMFAKYCEENKLAGSDDDFSVWSATVMEHAEDTMKKVKIEKKKKKSSAGKSISQQQQQRALPAVYSGKVTGPGGRISTGKRKKFDDSDDDEA